ncbi:uncharacterized protein LOC129762508 isoform X2 [Toxorhynchites rutilus septentrionalis]|uniref:uncharacterized protein LOC129762508 isoform X2 n=1 Tax=Toxorhynchites rutilus septentrionalis TaxID=329112 RepID=UPI00247A401F|nr:uncharacterized protein LOC129762508 isoform X2 [Toxorhynchites rutilus septentrionalis]
MSEQKSIMQSGTPGTPRRAKRAVGGNGVTTPPSSSETPPPPKTIVTEQRFEGLTLEGVNENLVDITPGDSDEVEAVNREEEVIKKRKTELTTTRQIETRIQRQLVFEDGKVVEDSGPIVSTNTTEDTDKQETVQTEHRTLGDPTEEAEVTKTAVDSGGKQDAAGGRKLVSEGDGVVSGAGIVNVPTAGGDNSNKPKTISAVVARPDGLLRDIKEEIEVSREETKERMVTEERKHFGDFTDDAYLRAINSGVDDIRELLLSEEARLDLVPSGPQLVSHSTKSRKVIDSENTNIQHTARPDGTLVTEKSQTRQHEVLLDDDLPGDERLSTGVDEVDSSERIIDQKASSQRYFKQRDEQHVDLIGTSGEVIGNEMRYAAETTQLDKEGTRPENLLSEWDSLSDRLRKARRLGRHPTPKDALVGGVIGVPPLVDRTDALTKRPLDFDREDETRKQETNKWLESHFGSESRSSRGSRDDLDDIVEPTKKTYFNVTIKSGDGVDERAGGNDFYKAHQLNAPPKVILPEREEPVGRKYFQGVSEWSERNRYANPRGSRENLVDSDECGYRTHGKQKDYRFEEGKNSSYKEDSAYVSSSTYFTTPRSPEHSKDSNFNARYGRDARSVSPDRIEYIPEDRPTAPQRKKALERKLTNGNGMTKKRVVEPQIIEYAPRSRSISPIQIPPVATTLRKPYQKTRFSSTQDLSHTSRPVETARVPRNPPKSKVGSAIGNSIRKLVGKIRSASAERKLRLKTSTKHRSPSPSSTNKRNSSSSTTYQQYNVIDGHIGRGYSPPPPPTTTATTSTPTAAAMQTNQLQNQSQHQHQHHQRHQSQSSGAAVSHKPNGNISRRDRERTDSNYDRRGSSDIVSDMTTNSGGPIPKQKYYLGENPYGGSIFGKENKYDGTARGGAAAQYHQQQQHQQPQQLRSEERIVTSSSHTRSYSQPPPPTVSTLGRFSKSTNRLPSTTTNGHHEQLNGSSSSYIHSSSNHYQNSSQTLPRKLYEQKSKAKPLHSSTINVSIVNTVSPTAQPSLANTGPVKPARTYKALNRSKSFNVHGLNGTNDPSPIYLEKLNKNNYNSFYRSNSNLEDLHHNPHSRHPTESMQLKSPSIVNLISRSTRDLTQSPLYEDERIPEPRNDFYNEHSTNKKTVFLKNLQNRAPELYRTLHGTDQKGHSGNSPSRDYLNTYINREQESSLGSRSPLTINKDTASIVRRGSSSTEDYSESYKVTQKSEDPVRPGLTNTVRNFSKKTIPTKDGRGMQTIETSEVRTTKTSRYRGPDGAGLKYQEFRNGIHHGNGTGGGGVVIELRGNP